MPRKPCKHGSKKTDIVTAKTWEEYHPKLSQAEKSSRRHCLSTTRIWDGIQSSAAPMVRNMDRTSVKVERKFHKRFSNT